jgi:autotransporter-associated beta strand protein
MKPMRASPKKVAVLFGLLMVVMAAQVQAASGTWVGTTDGTWATGSNWSGAAAPGAGETATFDSAGNGNTNIDVGAGVTVATLNLASGGAPYTFNGGGGIVATTEITMGADTHQTFGVPFTAPFLSPYNLANNGAGDLIFNSTYGFSSNRRGNFSGTGDIYLNGGTVNVEWCRKLGPNTLFVSNNVQFQYEMTFCEGTVNYNATNQNSGSYAYFIVGDEASKKVVFNMNGGLLTRQLNTGTGWGGRYYPVVLGYQTSSTGIVNQTGGIMNILGNSKIGMGAGSVGEYNISGGTYISQDDIIVGFNGTGTLGKLSLSGDGVVNIGPAATKWLKMGEAGSARGQIDISGGTLNLMNNTCIKMTTGTSPGGCVINQSGGSVTAYSDGGTTVGGTGNLDMKQNATPTCTNVYNLNGGTLTVPQIISSASTGTRTFNFNGGTLRAAVTHAAFINLGVNAARANVRDNGAIIDSNGKDITIAQALLHSDIDGDATTDGGLTKSGTGVLTLTGTSTYSGPTVVSNGTLTVSGTCALNGSSGITVNGSGAKFVQNSSVTSTPPVAVIQGALDGTGVAGAVAVDNGTGGVVANGDGTANSFTLASLAFGGAATVNIRTDGSNPGLIVSGALSTTPANGPVTVHVTAGPAVWVNGTTYKLIKFGSFGGAATDFIKGSVAGLGGRQYATLGLDSGSGYITLTVDGDATSWTGAVSADWSTATLAAPKNWKLVPTGTETDFATGDLSYFTDDAVGNFAVNLAENVAPASILFSNTAHDYTLSSAGGFGFSCTALTKDGAGKATLLTTNGCGAVQLNAGTLQFGDGTVDGLITNSSILANAASLVYQVKVSQSFAGSISGTGTVYKGGAGTLSLSGMSDYSGNTVLDGGKLSVAGTGTVEAGALGTGTLLWNAGALSETAYAEIYNPIITTNGATLTFGAENGSLILRGNMSGGATVNAVGSYSAYNVNGLGGDNSGFTGTFTAWGANSHGRMRFFSASAGSAVARWVNNAGWNDGVGLNFGSGTLHLGSFSGGGYLRNNVGGTTANLSVGALGLDDVLSGQLQDNGSCDLSLTKVGNGSLTLSGYCAYDGATWVSNGTLAVNGQLTASPVTVCDGAKLGGTGGISNTVSLASGATLVPGTSGTAGVLSIGTLNVASGGKFAFDLGATASSDKVVVSGTCTLDGLSFADCTFAGLAGLTSGDYVLIDAATLGGSLGGVTSGPLPLRKHGTLVIDSANNNLMLHVTNAGTLLSVR